MMGKLISIATHTGSSNSGDFEREVLKLGFSRNRCKAMEAEEAVKFQEGTVPCVGDDVSACFDGRDEAGDRNIFAQGLCEFDDEEGQEEARDALRRKPARLL